MRVVSLVPNATEIVFALGAGDLLVGVSHECDYPAAARSLPHLTGSALPAGLQGSEIDAAVSGQLASGKSLYTLDEELMASLAPDLLLTQELCPVCAVSTEQVVDASRGMSNCPEVLSLDPRTLADVFSDIRRVAERLGLAARGEELLASLEARLGRVRDRVAERERSVRVAALEWLDPPFSGGHWVPEMITLAGGTDVFAKPGDASRRIGWSDVRAAEPDLLVVMACGYDLEGNRRLVHEMNDEEWRDLPAVRAGRVVPVDANGCFSRPGPRLVDGIETLAEAFEKLAAT